MATQREPYDFAQAKEEYRAFCETGQHDIQIFSQPWYLDAVCSPDQEWRVILYKEKEKIVAAFPFAYWKGKFGLWHIGNPWQAPRMGIWIDYQGKSKKSARELLENKIVEYMIANLPYYDCFQVAFDARFKNWQQFYRSGFHQTSHYSYILFGDENLPDSFSQKTRWQIRNMYDEYVVDEDITPEEYWDFFEKSYLLRMRTINYSRNQFLKLVYAVMEHGCGYLVSCRNHSNEIAAVGFFLKDSLRFYPLFNTYDPRIKKSPQWLVSLYTIDLAKQFGLLYDFEGSMIPGVANYNLKFNSTQEPYFVITHESPKYRLLKSLQQSMQALNELLRGR